MEAVNPYINGVPEGSDTVYIYAQHCTNATACGGTPGTASYTWTQTAGPTVDFSTYGNVGAYFYFATPYTTADATLTFQVTACVDVPGVGQVCDTDTVDVPLINNSKPIVNNCVPSWAG